MPSMPFERVVATLSHETPDRVPCIPIVMSSAQHILMHNDITWHEVSWSPSKQARVAEEQYKCYGGDAMIVPFDFKVQEEAFGSKLKYALKSGKGFRMPMVDEYACKSIEDIDKLEIPDPKKAGRCPTVLKSIEILKKKYAYIVPIVVFVLHPCEVALEMLAPGAEKVFSLMQTNPPVVQKLLNKISVGTAEFIKEVFNAGADAIALALGSTFTHPTISLAQFREFVTPQNKIIADAARAPIVYHQCGDITPFFDEIMGVSPVVVSFHEMVDLKWAKEKYGEKTTVMGNISVSRTDSIGVSGTPEMVEKEAKKCVDIGKAGGGFILSFGCEVHHSVPEQNIISLVKSAEKYGKY